MRPQDCVGLLRDLLEKTFETPIRFVRINIATTTEHRFNFGVIILYVFEIFKRLCKRSVTDDVYEFTHNMFVLVYLIPKNKALGNEATVGSEKGSSQAHLIPPYISMQILLPN